jgi:hypothetical protein
MKRALMKTVCSLWLIVCSIVHASEQQKEIVKTFESFTKISTVAHIICSFDPKNVSEELEDHMNILAQAIQGKEIEPELLSKAVQDIGNRMGWCLSEQYTECALLHEIIHKREVPFRRFDSDSQKHYDLCGWNKYIVTACTDDLLKASAQKVFCGNKPMFAWQKPHDAKIYSPDHLAMKAWAALAWIAFNWSFSPEETNKPAFNTFFSYNPTGFEDSPKGITDIINAIGKDCKWRSSEIETQRDKLVQRIYQTD